MIEVKISMAFEGFFEIPKDWLWKKLLKQLVKNHRIYDQKLQV